VALEFADAIFAKGEELQGTMRALAVPRRSALRVGALATLSRNFQLTFLRPVIASGIVIRSGRLDELLQDLENYALDVVLSDVMPMMSQLSNVVVHTIAQQSVSLVGHTFPPRQQQSLEDLLRTEELVVPARPSSIRMDFDALVDRMRITPRIIAEVDDMAMLRLVAREHHCLAVVPPIVVKDELDSGVLVEVAQLPGLLENFYALTVPRQFPHPLLQEILHQSMFS
jgi:LysR family transcriptional activator of nhaA